MNDIGRPIDVAPRTFFRVPGLRDLDLLAAQVAFLGVPYDGGTPQPGLPTGQRAGPAAAREASGDQFDYPQSVGGGDDHGALREEVDALRELDGRWATSLDVIERGAGDVVRETVPAARARYVSIDLGVLDSSIAPGHSLPEPGGLSYRQLRAILVEVARRGRVIGFDIVELNPARDPSGATARVAAWIVTHFLSEIFDQPR